jgi:hypothetical protein
MAARIVAVTRKADDTVLISLRSIWRRISLCCLTLEPKRSAVGERLVGFIARSSGGSGRPIHRRHTGLIHDTGTLQAPFALMGLLTWSFEVRLIPNRRSRTNFRYYVLTMLTRRDENTYIDTFTTGIRLLGRSSAVEQSAVNRLVVGSNPTTPASHRPSCQPRFCWQDRVDNCEKKFPNRRSGTNFRYYVLTMFTRRDENTYIDTFTTGVRLLGRSSAVEQSAVSKAENAVMVEKARGCT